MGLFKDIKDAKAATDANYFRPGRYWYKIGSFRVKQNRKRQDRVILEGTIVNVLEEAYDADSGASVSHRIGDEVSHVFNPDSDYFLGEIKAFIVAVLEIAVDEVSEEECDQLVAEDQILAGFTVEVNAREVMTKENKPFTKIKYIGAVPEAQILENLAPATVAKYYPNGELEKRIEQGG